MTQEDSVPKSVFQTCLFWVEFKSFLEIHKTCVSGKFVFLFMKRGYHYLNHLWVLPREIILPLLNWKESYRRLEFTVIYWSFPKSNGQDLCLPYCTLVPHAKQPQLLSYILLSHLWAIATWKKYGRRIELKEHSEYLPSMRESLNFIPSTAGIKQIQWGML